MIVLAIVLGAVIGASLGALGAGGSILSVPVLVHVVGLPVHQATATSLVAVGAASIAAAATGSHRRNIRFDVALPFIAAGIIGSFLGAFVGEHLHADVMLIAFSVVMVVAAIRMARPEDTSEVTESEVAAGLTGQSTGRLSGGDPRRILIYVVAGVAVGFLTGLFGVGGGFVIIPVLTILLGMQMSVAVPTSLTVVAGNAIVSMFIRGLGSVDWTAATALTLPMLIGSLAGAVLAKHMNHTISARIFAAVLVAVALANALSVIM